MSHQSEMTCTCGHVDDEHVDGFRECTVAVIELGVSDSGAVTKAAVECPCFLFEADDTPSRRTV